MSDLMTDRDHMRAALGLAARGLGQTWPNPSVGCVIVRESLVVGRAATAPGGRPHAETQALAMAGSAARGAVAYVTLEPCSHHGETPPCADALIAAGIGRVVIAAGDPDPRVDGRGAARLRAAGIAVETGLLHREAAALNAGFFARVRLGRPLVTLKLASTLDGRIATSAGESRWITGPAARRAAHAMRGRADAIMVGVGTALADDPDLTCRIDGFRQTPLVRVVADSRLRTPPASRLAATARETPTWLLALADAPADRRAALEALGCVVMDQPAGAQGIDLAAGLAALGSAGITRLLVEGGASIAAELLRAGLVDRLAWFHAPAVMGGDGLAAASPLGAATLAAMPRFTRLAEAPCGPDMLTEFERA